MFFIILGIIGIIMILILAIYNSKIEIEIKNLDISTLREKGKKINSSYEIFVAFIIFEKWKIIKRKINKTNLKKIKSSKKLKDIDIKLRGNKNFDIEFENIINDLNLEIDKLDMQLEIGIEDAAITAISVGVISSILGIFLRDKITSRDKFEITPIYIQKNFINLKLNCIFRIKIIHYIINNILKERGKKNERKSSDRRSYAYSYE